MGDGEVWSVRHGLAPLLDLASWGGGLGVLGIAFLLGLGLLPRLRGWRAADRLLLRVLAGLIAAPLLLLGIGQIPGAIFVFPWRLLALGGWSAAALTAWRGRRPPPPEAALKSGHENDPGRVPLERALTLAGWGCVTFSLLGRLLPAFCPPLGYDTLEYHQGIIPHIFQAGRVTPIPHIFYSAQPLATEMLYTLAALLEGTPWGFAAGVIHWALVVLAALVGARLLQRLGLAPLWRPWLLLLLLEHPLLMHLQIERLSDWYGVLMLAGGVWVYCGLERSDFRNQISGPDFQSANWQSAILLGLFAGGALEAKWTHAGTVVLPLLALALGLGWDDGGGGTAGAVGSPARRVRGALAAGALCGAVTLLVWLPWGAWLWAERHNPFAPFLAGLFPSPEWPAARLHFLLEAHYPLHPTQWAYWSNLLRRLAWELPGPPLILLALLAAAALALWQRITKHKIQNHQYPANFNRQFVFRLAGAMVLSLLLWGNLQFAADRFLGPTTLAALVVLAVALREGGAALGLRLPARRARVLYLAAALLLAAGAAVYMLQTFAIYRITSLHALGTMDRNDYLNLIYGDEYRVIRAANALPPGSRILALNDARRYLYRGGIDVASVFDASPIRPAVCGGGGVSGAPGGAADAATIRRRLVQQGYTHILFNGYEQVRILRTQTPLGLVHDAAFQSILYDPRLNSPDTRAADAELARRFPATTEFSVDPLTPTERVAYLEFLATLQRRAVAAVSGELGAPAFWLAPLGGDGDR